LPRPVRFEATVLAGHKEDAVEVPFDPAERWGVAPRALRPGRRGYAVDVAIGRTRFASAIVPRSKRHWLLIPASVGVRTGDVVEVVVSPAV
jgi:uncharacterized protein DUF1905